MLGSPALSLRTAASAVLLAAPFVVFFAPGTPTPPVLAGPTRIVAWNDLGMHCGDPDFSVFAVLPPFNTVNAQVIRNNQLVTQGVTVTYEGTADPTGSINTTSIGKTNFWDHEVSLFGVSLPPDVGLTGNRMPGAANTPQPMPFDATWNWFTGEGIPLTPTDDSGNKNPYPLMRITAHDGSGNVIASTVTTVPNSQELECSICHASGASPFAMPTAGWVFDNDPVRDDRLNILRLHDDRHLGQSVYQDALQSAGYNQAGLYATAVGDANAVLCARCHASNALPGTGIAGITPLTEAIHSRHGNVVDQTAQRLDDSQTRAACYTCHPGFDTQCARGAMAKAIGPDGEFSMHCQNCHGDLSAVGTTGRTGWLDQPNCQNCHTGTATTNSGAIRFTSVFDSNGNPRTPASTVFATDPDTPAPGFSLYRFSEGHGGLQCSACHGSPHAIYPTAIANDNLQSLQMQGHVGTVTECSACHDKREDNQLIGPHGMHPATDDWADGKHGDVAEHGGLAQCRSCHGSDYRGTVLSLAQGNRTFSSKYGTKTFWRGFRVSCYACHNGPNSENGNPNRPPSVPDRAETTPNDVPLVLTATGTDADGDNLTFRIVSQPMRGTVGIQGSTLTYFPRAGYTGPDSFAYAAWDGDTDSNLGTISINVTAASCSGTIEAYGFGCPGSGDFMPVLSASGCPTPGGSVTFDLRNGYGGSGAVLMIGTGPATQMLADGCVLRLAQVIAVTNAISLSGSAPGEGSGSLTIGIPTDVNAGDLAVQAVLYDPGINRIWSLSNGLALSIR